MTRAGNRFNRRLKIVIIHGNFKFYFQQVADFLMTAIHFGNALLQAAAHVIAGRYQMDFIFHQFVQDLVKTIGLNYCNNVFRLVL